MWHSKLTIAEKSWTWKEIKKRRFSIIIGARSALFTPMKSLGLIIVDEEHDYSYKQDRVSPYYHARNTALMRAKFANIPIVLGSATPSMEMYYQKITKKVTWTKLKNRYGNASLPSIKMVDMMEEMKKNENFNSYLSSELKISIQNCLNKNEQVIPTPHSGIGPFANFLNLLILLVINISKGNFLTCPNSFTNLLISFWMKII